MYRINYIESIVSKNKKEAILFRVLRISTLFIQIACLILVIRTFSVNKQIDKANAGISKMKTVITEKRAKMYMTNIEKDWTGYYYKLKAVKQMIANRTTYGLLLKNFAELIPVENHVADIKTDDKDKMFIFDLELPKEKKEEYSENVYQYIDEIKTFFENNKFFNKDKIEVLGSKEEKINNKLVDLLDVKIEYKNKVRK